MIDDKRQAITLENVKRGNIIVAGAIVLGMILYLSKFLRLSFRDNDVVLFILGFLPNFGLAFAIPFIYVSNRIRLNKPVRHFGIACIATLLLMVLNEIRDQYQSKRVFDWLDIFGSLAGISFAFVLFHSTLKATSTEN